MHFCARNRTISLKILRFVRSFKDICDNNCLHVGRIVASKSDPYNLIPQIVYKSITVKWKSLSIHFCVIFKLRKGVGKSHSRNLFKHPLEFRCYESGTIFFNISLCIKKTYFVNNRDHAMVILFIRLWIFSISLYSFRMEDKKYFSWVYSLSKGGRWLLSLFFKQWSIGSILFRILTLPSHRRLYH